MEEEKKEKQKKEEKSLDKMTIKELRAIALEIPRSTAVHDMKKDELIAFISEARGITIEKPVAAVKKPPKVKQTKSEIKGKIRQLKKERQEVQETKNKKKSDLLRRRISRLKKQSRKFASA